MRDMGSFSGQLLIRSFDRAERVYNAMKCKGYAQHTPGYAINNTTQNNRRLTLHDMIFFAVVSVFCITFRFIDVNTLLTGFLGRFV